MVNWGIIGAGNIAHRFAKSLEHVEGAHLYAVARRTIKKAKEFQSVHPCDKVYDDYQALIDEEKVEAVYIALPHKFHLEWVEKSLKAKKAVLCEKPATMNLQEMELIQALAKEKKVFFMEAMKSRFTRAYQAVKQHIEEGDIGQLQHITTSLCRVFPEDRASYHYEVGQGGCLLDMGVYNIALIEDYTKEPWVIENLEFELTDDGVETYVNAQLSANQISATIESAFDRSTETVAIFQGSKGNIRLYDFHRPTAYDLEIDHKAKQNIQLVHEVDDFYGEISHVMDCLANNRLESTVMSMDNSVNVAGIMEEIKHAINNIR
ncbi:Gfo/Idh/MocA family protein [Aerococcaceae bacterium WGS1372]